MAYTSKFTIELWTKGGQLLADLAVRATGRSIVISRNQPEDIQFTLDVPEFEKYCATLGVDPKNLLTVNVTEVRIKRLGEYFVGGQLMYKSTRLDDRTMSVACRVFGFLALFNKRYTGTTTAGFVSEVYTAANGTAKTRTDLAWALISATQALASGDFGVTRGLTGSSATPRDKTYSRTNIKTALQDLTTLNTDPIDIEFTYNKVFNTYDGNIGGIGSNRADIVFEYPGNILSIEVPDDGTDMTNEVIGLASGSADGTQATYFAEDTASQATYALRQDIYQSNATDNSDNGLTYGAEAVKLAKSNPIKIPALVINGNVAPYVTDYHIGDRVTVKVNRHPLISDINGSYRIEKITLDIDDNDNEKVTLQVSAA